MEWILKSDKKRKLKPCPACGGDKVHFFEMDDMEDAWKIKCTNISCGLETGCFALKGKRAYELWQRMPRRCPVCMAATGCYDKRCGNCGRKLPWEPWKEEE